jgi:hypothetical protein
MAITIFSDAMPHLLAYLDPGSGSMLLQIALAGLLSGAFVLKSSLVTARERVTRFFRKDVARS